jgi:RsiW-degrading membrane proteinase PrsW (M82 family)
MNLLYTIIGFFSLGALIGIYLLSLILKGKQTPKAAALVHGLFVVAAVIMLIAYVDDNSPSPIESLILFILAALGGIVLIFRDLTGRSLPRWLVVGHGLVAIVGFIFLLAFTFTH